MARNVPWGAVGSRRAVARGDILAQWRPNRVVPAHYFQHFCSATPHSSLDSWVACRFSCDSQTEHLLALADDTATIYIADARQADETNDSEYLKKVFSTNKGMVLDVMFVAQRASQMLTISGHSNVTLWDFSKGVCLQSFVGHDGSVRAISQGPRSPDVFVTGSRDGTICLWDLRARVNGIGAREPLNRLSYTHAIPSPSVALSHRKKCCGFSTIDSSKGITSLVHLDENILASASAAYKTGIRLWDLRYRGKVDPLRVLDVPDTSSRRDFGVSCLCVDRYSSSLFAATTDSNIFEYSLNTSLNSPVGTLDGARVRGYNSFDVCLSASPNSDHLLFGGGDSCALIWDLQERNRSCESIGVKQKYLPYPKFVLDGHLTELSVARFSCEGRYIVTVDDTHWRAWQWRPCNRLLARSQEPEFSRVTGYRLPRSAVATSGLEQLNLMAQGCSPARSAGKRRTPMTSPFKSPFKSHSAAPHDRHKRTSAVKILRLSTSPLSNIENVDMSARVAAVVSTSSADDEVAKTPTCAFHYRYPTENLPDSVRERMLAKYKASVKENPKWRGKIEDFFAEHGQGASNCSRMVPLAEREEAHSPRKLVLRKRLRESACIAVKAATQATPHRSRGNANGASAMKAPRETPKSGAHRGAATKRSKRLSLTKTLKDFFSPNV